MGLFHLSIYFLNQFSKSRGCKIWLFVFMKYFVAALTAFHFLEQWYYPNISAAYTVRFKTDWPWHETVGELHTHTHTHVHAQNMTQYLFFPSSPITVMVLGEEPQRFHAASFTNTVQFYSSSSFPLTHSPALLFCWSPWFRYILLKSSYTSARQPGRQRQAAVNYLSFRADGCRRYVNVCVSACVCFCL